MSRVSTAYLLTCAAIGVAGGILLWGATGLSTLLFATVPFISVALAGLWLVPAVVALRLLQRPLAGLLVGLLSGLVVFPYLFTNLWWAFFAELPFLIVIYRFWSVWQHYAGAVVVGVVYPILAAASFNLWAMPVWSQIGFFALTLASCVIGTGLGILIADRLAHAGVARLARRKPKALGVATPTGSETPTVS
ncbi:ECF transporter S component [Microbacterium pygmaeum]|uniref:Energy-coupling factor transport system substrate-specific component n=1 Tax=Microbacterium pygmaeum TaxID=370764 RepID=A0A1G7U8T0_9MICO|nr:ECF transporter S component [Microbacterium pygmaeum]SDG43834.1 energy-coupling factor transport system substrate-specific component [Microbacterium pygmaeum]